MTDAWYTAKRDGTVKNSMAKYGLPMTLVVPAVGTYTEGTGAFTAGTDKTYAVQGLIGNYRKSRKGDTAVQSKTRYIYLSPSGMTVEPEAGNKLRIGSTDYEIVDVELVQPGGITVLYQLEVRLP